MVLGFIGAGNMATALMRGMMDAGIDACSFAAFDVDARRMDAMQDMGIQTAESIGALCGVADVIVLAVKPKFIADVTASLRTAEYRGNVLSIALGWTQARLAGELPGCTILRALPNTPSAVGEGVIALNDNHSFPSATLAALRKMLDTCGRTLMIPESLFNALSSISGSGPAYVYMFIEALADGGVQQGLSRELSYTLAAQTVLGAAKMVLETHQHPGVLKDAVASPAGATIDAIYALEKAGFRGAVIEAVDVCTKKADRITGQ